MAGQKLSVDLLGVPKARAAGNIGKTIRVTNGRGVFADSDDYIPPYTIQGSIAGYTMGGGASFAPGNKRMMDKFSFVSDGNSTCIGLLATGRSHLNSNTSPEKGYDVGGGANSWVYGQCPHTNVIGSFPFAAEGSSTNVGTLATCVGSGGDMNSEEAGYQATGIIGGSPSFPAMSGVQKFPFASETTTCVGPASYTGYFINSGMSDTFHGYYAGGRLVNSTFSTIAKFGFSSDTACGSIGNLTSARYLSSGVSAQTESRGYVVSGCNTSAIDLISFASDGNSTCVGEVTVRTTASRGHSSLTHGYTSCKQVYKFPFNSEGTQACIGNSVADGCRFANNNSLHGATQN